MGEPFHQLIKNGIPWTRERLFDLACQHDSDIRKHVPTLRRYAEQSDVVLELGVRYGVSTVALLAGQPKTLVSVDVNDVPNRTVLQNVSDRTDWTFRKESSLETGTVQCDLLFIDTIHTAEQLQAELNRHAHHCKRWIIFHDTQKFTCLWKPIGDLLSRGEWYVAGHTAKCNGLTILERINAQE